MSTTDTFTTTHAAEPVATLTLRPPAAAAACSTGAAAATGDGGAAASSLSGIAISDDDLAVAPLSEKDGEVFSLDFNTQKHHFCRRPCVQLQPSAEPPRVESVPGFAMDGTYAILNVLSREECQQIIALTERMGYEATCIAGIAAQDKALHGPDKVVWCADQALVDTVFERCRPLLPQELVLRLERKHGAEEGGAGEGGCDKEEDDEYIVERRLLKTLSPRFRCLRYREGEHQLGPHRDRGLYPLSQVDSDGELRYDVAGDGSRSYMSFLIYLNEAFDGGETFFYAEDDAPPGDDSAAAGASAPAAASTFAVGSTVSAVWFGDDDWYDAVVAEVHVDEDGDVTYDVEFTQDGVVSLVGGGGGPVLGCARATTTERRRLLVTFPKLWSSGGRLCDFFHDFFSSFFSAWPCALSV
jgi:hypothetical protein